MLVDKIQQLFLDIMAAKRRIILTIFAIAWGTVSIAVMLSVGEGLRLQFATMSQSIGQNVILIKGGETSKNYLATSKNQTVNLNLKDYAAIESLRPLTIGISREYRSDVTIINGKQITNFTAAAVEPEYSLIRNILPAQGRFISAVDIERKERVVFLGGDVANIIFPNEKNIIGKKILIDQMFFTVIGVMKDKFQSNNFSGASDGLMIYIPASTYEMLVEPTAIDDIVLTPLKPEYQEQIENSILHIVANLHGLDPGDLNIVNFHDTAKAQEKTAGFFIAMEIILGIIGSMTLLVAAVGIANVMLAAVKRATREIGIKMALGASAKIILWQYLLEALLSTFFGGIIGLILTLIINSFITHLLMHSSLVKSIGGLSPKLSFLVIFTVLLILGITGVLAGIIPAKKAASIDPAKALHYE